MHPQLAILGFTVPSYIFFYLLGINVCLVGLVPVLVRRRGLSWETLFPPIIAGVFAGWIAAVLAAKLINQGLEGLSPSKLFDLSTGAEGVAGVVAGVIVFWVTNRKTSAQAKSDFNDALAAPVAFMVAFFKLGCLMQGCCYGRPTHASWYSVIYPKGSQPFDHQQAQNLLSASALESLPTLPSQHAEMILMSAVGIILLALYVKKRFRGQLIFFFFISYAIWRNVAELFFRGDPGRGDLGPITVTQAFTIPILAYSFYVIIAKRKARPT